MINYVDDFYLLDTGKLSTYFKFKFTFNYESYLNMNNFNNRRILAKFRMSNHSLRIEIGRYEPKLNTVSGKLELLLRCERLCQHCSHDLIENELHFVLECPLYNSPRLDFLENLFQKFPNLRNINLENLFIWIMSNEDLDFNAVFSVFLGNIFKIRQGKKDISYC